MFDLCIEGELKIESTEKWNKQLVMENCLIEYFSGSVTQFEKQVQFINCNFKNCQFVFTYFLGGLTIENCTFDNYLDFQAGGHNQKGNSIIIANNDFKGFVNFFDCIYEDDVIIENNKFQKGTNLLGKPFNIPVTFSIKPFIDKNVGQLDANDEGETR
ncbi:hypothetical protein Q73A0000_05740 [Kaistella flava (ex Peng et al. 2021)]|uniref:Right handed beta helix domain-containing protein n=1 Tax=Kaistella flava (ex Peng et al. 2021) TaxID=2038776 RepID=A0A7M2Y6M5_9FLAO|nr:hypothetical protein [Kaistella flava (ex Peng et al. 2021)]QOW09897.1 hypothetical protein Q73A0000_05740 [Kaistella flava (ex Peng et al. 2021)]